MTDKQLSELHAKNRTIINSSPLSDWIPLEKKGGSYCCPICGYAGPFFMSNKNGKWRVCCNKADSNCFGTNPRTGKPAAVDNVEALMRIRGYSRELDLFRELNLPTGSDTQRAAAPRNPAEPALSFLGPSGSAPHDQNTVLDWDSEIGSDEGGADPAAAPEPAPAPVPVQTAEQAAYCRDVIEKAVAALPGSAVEDYLFQRGLTDNTIRAFRLGAGLTPDGQPAVVIPYPGKDYFEWRVLNPGKDDAKVQRPSTAKGGPQPEWIYRGKLPEEMPTVIVEGPIDAMSICQESRQLFSAVALCRNTVRQDGPQRAFLASRTGKVYLLPDNDKYGEIGAENVKKAIPDVVRINLFSMFGCKDANEMLQRGNPGELREAMDWILNGEAEQDPEATAAAPVAPDPDPEPDPGKESPGTDPELARTEKLDSLMHAIMDLGNPDSGRIEYPAASGFRTLDGYLDGGFYSQSLVIIGGESSIGKSSFCAQMADQIAENGRDVLYFSIEMETRDMMAKTISRGTYQKALQCGDMRIACTSRQIVNPLRWKIMSQEQRDAILDVKADITQRMLKSRGIVEYIRPQTRRPRDFQKTIEDHKARYGQNPVVIIDYLQILEPSDKAGYEKRQQVEQIVKELYDIAHNSEVCVICISSFNRGSYEREKTEAAFKESGTLEYSSDVLIALDYASLDGRSQERDSIRELQLKLLKNRFGARDRMVRMEFNAKYNYYKEVKH